MGTTESKGNPLHKSSKYPRYKHEASRNRKCQHKRREREIVIEHNGNSLARKQQIPGPLNPSLHGSILHHSFPMQRAQSEMHIAPLDRTHEELAEGANRAHYGSYEHPRGAYDYRTQMQRVDEENRRVLEGLCPEMMYVATNDLHVCDTQRLPPPVRCKATQGFFRPISPSRLYERKNTLNGSVL